MGRPQKRIATPNEALERLAFWLRVQRERAGLTYHELAERTTCSASTLARAAAGERVPRLPTVEAYARACEASVADGRRMWRAARAAEQRHTRVPRSIPDAAPRPELVQEPADLHAALRALYYKSGAMPLAEMERRAGGHGRLPHSTVHRMLKGATMFRQDQLTAFLDGCGVPVRNHPQWHRAWERAWRSTQPQTIDAIELKRMLESAVHTPFPRTKQCPVCSEIISGDVDHGLL
ncbi:helix-turn-helix domain-containing protein, partial [Streptomyces sp. TR06-5]|uniref:helix-turn-helix domain-containing protein n=1 Tax=Streptomyces sp. TR06-5 TaxID=3385976 RepID=UPI0039A02F59